MGDVWTGFEHKLNKCAMLLFSHGNSAKRGVYRLGLGLMLYCGFNGFKMELNWPRFVNI